MAKWKGNILGLVSIAATLLAFINEKDRLLVGVIFAVAIVFYIVDSFTDDIDEHGEKIKKLEEKLQIYEQLVDMKADITHLKKEVSKK
jgi:hypothetical protein